MDDTRQLWGAMETCQERLNKMSIHQCLLGLGIAHQPSRIAELQGYLKHIADEARHAGRLAPRVPRESVVFARFKADWWDLDVWTTAPDFWIHCVFAKCIQAVRRNQNLLQLAAAAAAAAATAAPHADVAGGINVRFGPTTVIEISPPPSETATPTSSVSSDIGRQGGDDGGDHVHLSPVSTNSDEGGGDEGEPHRKPWPSDVASPTNHGRRGRTPRPETHTGDSNSSLNVNIHNHSTSLDSHAPIPSSPAPFFDGRMFEEDHGGNNFDNCFEHVHSEHFDQGRRRRPSMSSSCHPTTTRCDRPDRAPPAMRGGGWTEQRLSTELEVGVKMTEASSRRLVSSSRDARASARKSSGSCILRDLLCRP